MVEFSSEIMVVGNSGKGSSVSAECVGGCVGAVVVGSKINEERAGHNCARDCFPKFSLAASM